MKNIILTNLTLIDGTGQDPLENATIITENDRIKEIFQGSPSSVPSSAYSIDCRGQYLIPGLIDCHVHVGSTKPSIVEQHRRNFPTYSLLKSLKSIKRNIGSALQPSGIVVAPTQGFGRHCKRNSYLGHVCLYMWNNFVADWWAR